MHPYKRLEQATAARVALEREWKKDTEEYRAAVAAENLAYDKLHDPRPSDDAEVVDLGDARPIPPRRNGVYPGPMAGPQPDYKYSHAVLRDIAMEAFSQQVFKKYQDDFTRGNR